MLAYSWRFHKCPECNTTYNWKFEKLYMLFRVGSGLGPPIIQCAKCGHQFDSGLKEWKFMNAAQKLRYGIWSLIYSAVIGFSLAEAGLLLYGQVAHIRDRFYPEWNLTIFASLVVAMVVVFLQLIRIELSHSRTESPDPAPMEASFWNWQINLQFLGLMMIGFVWISFFIIFMVFK